MDRHAPHTSDTLLAQLPGLAYRCAASHPYTLLEASEGTLSLTGYPVADLLTHHATQWRELIHPDDRARVERAIQRALHTQAPYDIDYRIHTANGTPKHVIEYGAARYDDRGQRIDLTGFISDATVRAAHDAWQRQAQAAIVTISHDTAMTHGDITGLARVAARHCADTLAVSRVGIWLFNSDKTVLRLICLYQSDTGEHRFDLEITASDYPIYFTALASGRAIDADNARTDLRTQEFAERYLIPNHIHSLLDSAIRIGTDIVGIVCCEQQQQPRHWRTDEMAFVGEVADQLAQVISIHARFDSERCVLMAQANSDAKSRFLATMSHEIRTPLNGVLGMAQLLEDTGLNPKQQHLVNVIRESGTLLLDIINDVLDYSKIEAGKLSLMPHCVELRKLLNTVLQFFERDAQRHAVRLTLTVAADVPVAVMLDSSRLKQILLNLLGNALKFTEHGSVTLRVQREQGNVVFSIEDTGVGIAPSRMDSLFQPFEQVHADRQMGNGTGLGLTISRRLAGLMGGTLTAHSDGSTGSTFTLSLPLETADVPQMHPARTAQPPVVSLAGMRVYVAEDNALNQEVVSLMLEALGIESVLCQDGAELLARLEQEPDPIDAILMDCEMPVLSGYDATVQLRAREWIHRNTPVVALTAHALPEFRRRAEAAGMTDYITKPVQRAILESRLRLLRTPPHHVDIHALIRANESSRAGSLAG